ncbi:hypothetical protein JOL62DRAFT_229905 [Phyllosticta paracitricarpa]|uniref:Uncharacterized protein n=1 Tax=Phyllosticta paracitricarpa TaxID=2016321 RepID=A0ABR1NHJ4_9PEZI
MAAPPSPFTTVNGKRCTRVPRVTTTITAGGSVITSIPFLVFPFLALTFFQTVTSTGDLSTTAAFSASTSLSATPTATAQNDAGRSLSPGAVAGVVLGSLVGVILAGLLLLWCVRKTRERNRVYEITEKVSDKKTGGSRFGFNSSSASSGLREHPPSISSPFPFLNSSRTFRANRTNGQSQDRLSAESNQSSVQNRLASAPLMKSVQEVTDSFKRRMGRERLPSIDSTRSFQSAFPVELPVASLDSFADLNRVSTRIANTGDVSLPRRPDNAVPGLLSRPTIGVAFGNGGDVENPFLDSPDGVEISRGLRKLVSMERLRGKATVDEASRPPDLIRPIKGKAIISGEAKSADSRKQKSPEYSSRDSGYTSPAHRSAEVAPLKIVRKYSPLTQLANSPATSVEDPDNRPASILILPPSRSESYDTDNRPPVIPLPSGSIYSRPLRGVPAGAEEIRGRPQFRGASPKSSRTSSRRNSYLGQRSQSRRRKSDPFDLDRPEVLGDFDDGFVMAATPRLLPGENPFGDDASFVESMRPTRSNSRRAAAGAQAEAAAAAAAATTRRVFKAIVPRSPRSPRGPWTASTAF